MSDQPPYRRAKFSRTLERIKGAWQKKPIYRRTTPGPSVEAAPKSLPESPKQSMEIASSTVAEPASVGPQNLEVDDEISEPNTEEALKPLYLPIKRGASHQSKAVMMANSYGYELPQSGSSFYDDGPSTERLRVEKKIRMRVRYTCHKCSTQFGRHAICSNCDHSRCKDCHKFPDKRRRIEEPRDANTELKRERNTERNTSEVKTAEVQTSEVQTSTVEDEPSSSQ